MLRLKHLTEKLALKKPIKMLVFDMAGTTVNEKGIIYHTIYDTLKMFNFDVYKDDMHSWHGLSKNEILLHYLNKKYNIPTSNINIPTSNINIPTSNPTPNTRRRHTNAHEFHHETTVLKQELLWTFKRNLKINYFNEGNISIMSTKMPDLFNRIRDSGVKITLNTGYDKDIQTTIIDRLNMDSFIDDCVASDEVMNGRPYPHMIELLMQRNEITDPSQVIKFGDTKNDILEGKHAKCLLSVGVLTGAGDENELINADYILNSVMDIVI